MDEVSHTWSKRPRRNTERTRVTRACDRCKKRKIKCDGRSPCEICTRSKSTCTFESIYARGRVPSIPRAPHTEPGAIAHNEPEYSNSPSSLWPQQPTHSPIGARDQRNAASDDLTASHGYEAASALATSNASPAQSSPHSTRTGLHGMYLGPASGVSFLVRVQKRLDQAISFSHPGSIFTFGDAPLPFTDADPSFCMMLPKDDARRLLDRFFDFAMPTFRFLHQPSIQTWFEEFYSTLGQMRDPQTAPGRVALLLMVLAHGKMYMPVDDTLDPQLSLRLFLAAEHQLSREKGAVRLTSIQARLTMCFFLLTQSRINQSWNLFGTVSHLALAIGLNRSRRFDLTSVSGQVEAECRRRTFWCAYTLDCHLAVVLGRPKLFHDDDIDIELPRCLEDNELCSNTPDTLISYRPQSTMLAPIAHYKLARIIAGKILRDLYSIKPISSARRAVLNERISRNLSDWRVEFAEFLDADDSSTPRPIFQRARNVLNLTYWHAIILTHRPLVLTSFASYSERKSSSGDEDIHIEESVRECLRASMHTVRAIDTMHQDGKLYRAFWIAAYFAFSASVLLYIYVLHRRASPPEVYNEYLAAAIRCQSHMSGIAEKGSLAERYCLLLEELRAEAVRQTDLMRPSTASRTDMQTSDIQWHGNNMQTSMPVDGNTSLTTGNTEMMGTAEFNDMMATDPLPFDYSGWSQFAEMVSSGLGNLDTLLGDDSFRF